MTDENSGDDGRGNAGEDREGGDPFDFLDADQYRNRRGDPFENLGRDNGGPGSGRGTEEGSESGDRPESPPDRDDPFTFPGDGDRDPIESPEWGTRRESAEPPEQGTRRESAEPPEREEREETETTPEEDARTAGSDEPGTGGIRSDIGIPSGGPFSDVDDEESPFESGTNAFEEVDVDDVDADEVWESLVGGDGPESAAGAREEVEVSKHSYCEGCEYFSAPPDVHCTHEGTEILEFVDMETVRVLDCPVVAERRELERE